MFKKIVYYLLVIEFALPTSAYSLALKRENFEVSEEVRLAPLPDQSGMFINHFTEPRRHFIDPQSPHLRVVMISDIHSRQDYMAVYNESLHLNKSEKTPSLENLHKLRKVSFLNFPTGDVLIVSGDFTGTGGLNEMIEFRAFLEFLINANHFRKIVLIAGNHERTLDTEYFLSFGYIHMRDTFSLNPEARIAYLDSVRSAFFEGLNSNIIYLQDSYVVIDGFKFYGTPWTVGDSFWAFSKSESDLIEKWAMIPVDTDILISHMPPLGQGDLIEETDRQGLVKTISAGSKSLASRVHQIEPLLHVFGHFHSGYGVSKSKKMRTLFINAATCDEAYAPRQKPLVIDIQASSRR